MRLIFEQDWLGSRPYFYDESTGKHGPKIWDAMDFNEISLDPSGLYNYFTFGYSVFGSTAIKSVKFVEANSRLWSDNAGNLIIDHVRDPIEDWPRSQASVEDVIDRLSNLVSFWAKKQSQPIVLPLSGGLDSRLLLWALPEKSVVHAYTYGVSKNQQQSTEVIYASEISAKQKIQNTVINLSGFHEYLDEWNKIYGVAVHAHGMYQMKFYDTIRKRYEKKEGGPLLSGIFGDVWAGSIPFMNINSPNQVVRLGYTHGIHADPLRLIHPQLDGDVLEIFWSANKEKIKDPQMQIVVLARFKMMLLSYLLSTPRAYGFAPWSPFLDCDLVRAMLFLPSNLRKNRAWQQDFLAREGLGVSKQLRRRNSMNSLDFDETARTPLTPLDEEMLGEYVSKDYIRWINSAVKVSPLRPRLIGFYANAAVERLNFPRRWAAWRPADNAYTVLYPVQEALAQGSLRGKLPE